MTVGDENDLEQPGELFQCTLPSFSRESDIFYKGEQGMCIYTHTEGKGGRSGKESLSDTNIHPLTPLNENHCFKPMQSY